MRIYKLGDKSLWHDEFLSIRDSEKIDTAILKHGHPPFFYIILHLFRYLGENEFVLRLPSAILGIVTIFVIYKIGCNLYGTKEGLISAFLLSISTFHIFYSQEARMYALFCLFSLLSLFYFYKAINYNKKRFWFWYIFSTVLNLYTHDFALFIITVEFSFFILKLVKMLIYSPKVENKDIISLTFKFILSGVIIIVLYLPWGFGTILHIYREVSYIGEREPGWLDIQWAREESGIKLLPVIFSKFSAGYDLSLFVFLLFFLFGSFINIKKDEELMLLLWIGLPIILMLLISTYIRPIISNSSIRFIIYILPIYLLIVSRGIVNLVNLIETLYIKRFKKFARVLIVKLLVSSIIMLFFIGISITPLYGYYNKDYTDITYKPYYKKQDWKGAIQYIKSHLIPEDIIGIGGRFTLANHLSYYFDDILENITIVRIKDSINKLEDIKSTNNRVWVILQRGKIEEEISNWFYENFGLGQEFTGAIHVYLMQPELFKTAIIGSNEHAMINWKTILSFLGASSTIFNDTIRINDINLSEYKIIVLDNSIRPFDNVERLCLEKFVQKGLIVILSGKSPKKIAGGTCNLTLISKWFGATDLFEAPLEERWKVRFSKEASEILTELDFERDYAFYSKRNDGTSPLGCRIQSESVVYAYRVNDKAITIFTHEFGNGTSVFIGLRDSAFNSPDAETFKAFLQEFIRFVLTDTS